MALSHPLDCIHQLADGRWVRVVQLEDGNWVSCDAEVLDGAPTIEELLRRGKVRTYATYEEAEAAELRSMG